MRALISYAIAGLTGFIPMACAVEVSQCGPESARVIRVIDGDTIELEDHTRVRYLMIDTPELSGTAECFGAEARDFNRSLVAGEVVQLRYDAQCEDRYGRLLALVSIDGRDVNRALVENGFACVLFIPPNGESLRDEFAAIEHDARRDGVGLWGHCATVACK